MCVCQEIGRFFTIVKLQTEQSANKNAGSCALTLDDKSRLEGRKDPCTSEVSDSCRKD